MNSTRPGIDHAIPEPRSRSGSGSVAIERAAIGDVVYAVAPLHEDTGELVARRGDAGRVYDVLGGGWAYIRWDRTDHGLDCMIGDFIVVVGGGSQT